jgi:hypothetical protein
MITDPYALSDPASAARMLGLNPSPTPQQMPPMAGGMPNLAMRGTGMGGMPGGQSLPMTPMGGGISGGMGGAPASQPYMRLVGNNELFAVEQQRAFQDLQNQPQMIALAGHIRKCHDAAVQAKLPIQERILKCRQMRNGQYTQEQLMKIRKYGGAEIFMQLTSIKCRAAESWIRDIMRPPGDKPWSLSPTPIADLPPKVRAQVEQAVIQKAISMGVLNPMEIMSKVEDIQDKILLKIQDEADKRAERLSKCVDDALIEGNWYDALDEFITDLVTDPTAFLKGPTIRRKKKLIWGEDGAPKVEDQLVREFDRVDAKNIFPSPSARTLQDGYLTELDPVTRASLAEFIGTPGYSESEIRKVLQTYPAGLREHLHHDNQFATLEARPYELIYDDPEGKLDSIIFWGSCQGRMLREWGMSEQEVPDMDLDYEICARLIGQFVIKAVLNPDPLKKRPYYCASFENVANSIWGKAVPELMADIQDICNASARAMVNNLSISSGPQVGVDASRLEEGEDVREMYPWKVWEFRKPHAGAGDGSPPITFFSPNSITPELLKVFDFFFQLAGEVTGIPNYIHGIPATAGAARTASGLSMYMNAAGKGIKQVIFHIDDGVVVPSITAQCNHIMLYDDKPEIRGDVVVKPMGSTALVVQEQRQIRLNEFLTIVTNPIFAKIIGKKGVAQILREQVKGLHLPTDQIVPSDEELDAQINQEQIAAVLMQLSKVMGIPVELFAQALSQGQGAPMGGAGGQEGQVPPGIMAPNANAAGMQPNGSDTQTMQPRNIQ